MALYGNNIIYSPEGILMFRADDRRANWYLSRGLAKLVKEDEEGKHIELLFKPGGNGHANDPFYTEKKKNICVCCGDADVEVLTKHHVVPYVYRKFFPLEFKDRSSHDVLLICKKHHYEYEEHAYALKNILAEEYQVPSLGASSLILYDTGIKRSKGIAYALLNYNKQMPKERIEQLCEEFESLTSLPATNKNLDLVVNSELGYSSSEIEHGKAVVDKIEDYQAFVERWRQHFLDYAKPQFLSEHWSVTREITKQK